MTALPSQEVLVTIRTRWALLTDDDIQHGLQHRENFLDRLRHRYNLGLEDAMQQLRAFEKDNPGLAFEKV